MSWDKIWSVKCGKFLWKKNRSVLHEGSKMERPRSSRFVGTLERRYKLWHRGKDAKFGGVEIFVREETSGNVVEVRRKSDRVMAIVLTLGRKVMRIVCACGP